MSTNNDAAASENTGPRELASGPGAQTTNVLAGGPDAQTTNVLADGPDAQTTNVLAVGPGAQTTNVLAGGPGAQTTNGSGHEEDRVVVAVDAREPPVVRHAFEELTASLDWVRVEHERLDVGDFEIRLGGKTKVVVERKEWADLESSLARGTRLKEQLSRMLPTCRELSARPFLLVEHPRVPAWRDKAHGISVKMIDSFLLRLACTGVAVLRAKTVEHTAQTVLKLADMVLREGLAGFTANADAATEGGYHASVSAKKSENDTPARAWRAMLQMVRGVSASKADVIAGRYASASELISAFSKEKETKTRKRLLTTLDGVGDTLAKRVCVALGVKL